MTTNEEIKHRVIRLGKQYGFLVKVTEWDQTFMAGHLGWRIDIEMAPGQHAIALLRRGCGDPYVEYGWGAATFPDCFGFEDFSVIFERAARRMGYERTDLRIVR